MRPQREHEQRGAPRQRAETNQSRSRCYRERGGVKCWPKGAGKILDRLENMYL